MVVKKGLTGIDKDYLYLFGPFIKIGIRDQIEIIMDFNLNRGDLLTTEQYEFLQKMGIKYFVKGDKSCKAAQPKRTILSRLKKSFLNLAALSSASNYKFKEAFEIRGAVEEKIGDMEIVE
jgi:hypothetical protein